MDFKSFSFGILATLMVFITIGASIAAVVPSGTVINVPAGKNAFYIFIGSDYNDEVQDAAKYWDGMNETKTVTQSYVDLNSQGVSCLKEWIVVGHKLYDEEVFKKSQVSINPVE